MKKAILILALAILILCTSCKKEVSDLPKIPADTPQDMKLSVRTDYSGLTPSTQAHIRCTRLREEPLMELIPSNDYGMLLPYASSTMIDGSPWAVKYGFVTTDGVIVTDLVFDRIDWAYYQYRYSGTLAAPAYELSINVLDTETQYETSKRAACALDGSWITPFDYESIQFTEEAILLLRKYDSFDIDVYDYNGQRLYNMLDMEWIDDISSEIWPGGLAYNTREGYGVVEMKRGTYSVFDVRTGKIRHTQFVYADPFSEGLAVASPDYAPDFRGFINTDLEFVIPPIYYIDGAAFMNGQAIVRTNSGEQLVIDKQGKTLFFTSSDYRIDINYDGSGYTVNSYDWQKPPKFYTNDFVEIKLREEAYLPEQYTHLLQFPSGFYAYSFESGAVLLTPDDEYYFPGNVSITYADATCVVWVEHGNNSYLNNVETLNGEAIIPAAKNASVSVVKRDNEATAFIISAGESHRDDRVSTYKLFDFEGNLIASGVGTINYYETLDLCSVLSEDSYTWLDTDGRVVIKIPMMSYMLD